MHPSDHIAIRRHIALDGEKITSLDDLYIDLAEKLQFPDYFGHNLDALADCL
jgi:ribonuclease inhibitor